MAAKKKTKDKPKSKAERLLAVQERMHKARSAIAAYVDAEIALCGNPPNPSLAHSSIARFFLYNQVEALKKLDAWVDAEFDKRARRAAK